MGYSGGRVLPPSSSSSVTVEEEDNDGSTQAGSTPSRLTNHPKTMTHDESEWRVFTLGYRPSSRWHAAAWRDGDGERAGWRRRGEGRQDTRHRDLFFGICGTNNGRTASEEELLLPLVAARRSCHGLRRRAARGRRGGGGQRARLLATPSDAARSLTAPLRLRFICASSPPPTRPRSWSTTSPRARRACCGVDRP